MDFYLTESLTFGISNLNIWLYLNALAQPTHIYPSLYRSINLLFLFCTGFVSDKLWPPHTDVIVFCVWISFKCQQQAATACCGVSLLLWHKQTHKYTELFPHSDFCSAQYTNFCEDTQVSRFILGYWPLLTSDPQESVISPEVDGC